MDRSLNMEGTFRQLRFALQIRIAAPDCWMSDCVFTDCLREYGCSCLLIMFASFFQMLFHVFSNQLMVAAYMFESILLFQQTCEVGQISKWLAQGSSDTFMT